MNQREADVTMMTRATLLVAFLIAASSVAAIVDTVIETRAKVEIARVAAERGCK